MPTLSENGSAALMLAGYAESAQLPNATGTIFRIINQVARMMMREARLSEENQYLRFAPLNSPQKEQLVPLIVDCMSICTVELLTDLITDTRADIDIVSRVDLNAKEEQGVYACARFGSPTRIRFSWDPSLSGDTILIGYESLPPTDVGDMSDVPRLPESFHDCIVYRSAALFKETVLGKECTSIFLETMGRIEEQWKTWCDRGAEERPTVKPGFGSLDWGDPMEGSWF